MPSALRVVPIITVTGGTDLAAERDRYLAVFGLSEVMNHGWIVTLADAAGRCQVSLMTTDATAPVNPDVSIEVDDVDAAHATAVAQGFEIVHPLQDEDWGVRRFFFRDASGTVVNVLAHRR